jgi:hypothetical protein
MLFCPTKIDFGFESILNEMQMCLFRATYFLTQGLLTKIKRKISIFFLHQFASHFFSIENLNQLNSIKILKFSSN